MADYLTFQNIYEEVERVANLGSNVKRALAKSVINQVYLNEIMVADDLFPLFWTVKLDDTIMSKESVAITGVTAANPGVVTSATHGLETDDVITIYNIIGVVQLNHRTFRVVKINADTFSLKTMAGTAVNTTSYTAYSSGGTWVHRGAKMTAFNVDQILSAAWADEKPMVSINHDELNADTEHFFDTVSVPDRYYHHKELDGTGNDLNFILWFQGATSVETLRAFITESPARLSADADVPKIPAKFHDMIIAGAVTRLIESNVQVENQVVWPSLYLSQLDSFRTYNRSLWKRADKSTRIMPDFC